MSDPPARPSPTIYLYELAWILPSIAIPVGMLAALTVTAVGAGITCRPSRGACRPPRSPGPGRTS